MRLTVFRSDKGDCVLLKSADGAHMLEDGGMRTSYTAHVSRALDRLRRNGETLDVVCVSHIDRDHVFGLLQMLDDLVEWRVYDYQRGQGNSSYPRPKVKRPPEIGRFWHNAFHEQISDNAGRIADLLAAEAMILSGHPAETVREHAAGLRDLAFSEGDAIELSRRIGDEQLAIPLNPEYGGHLMFHASPTEAMAVGSMNAWVIGPFEEDLQRLREEWNDWLRTHATFLHQIQRRAEIDEDRLGHLGPSAILGAMEAQAVDLAESLGLDALRSIEQAAKLGDRKKVTVPNLASLMLLIEENGRTVLLTGDGHCDDVLDGLAMAGLLDASDRLHVDVLKVPHHGSEHNTHPDFCRAITADTYVFCGNGAHHNPDLAVIKAYIDSRLGTPEQRSPNAETATRFRMVFSAHPDNDDLSATEREHMEEVLELVEAKAAGSGGRLRYKFLEGASYTLAV